MATDRRATGQHQPGCRPDHRAYASGLLAANTAELHALSGECEHMVWWPCGDHFHVGHASKVDGDACRAARPLTRPGGATLPRR